MDTEFNICGTHIPYDKITDYCLVNREYIYRPSFIEIVNTQKKLFQTYTTTEYKFDRMLPYAMILSREDMDFKKATKISVQKGTWCNFASRPLKQYKICFDLQKSELL